MNKRYRDDELIKAIIIEWEDVIGDK